MEGEMEEARYLLDSAERGKKQAENELSEARSAINEMTGTNTKVMTEKRAAESEVHTLHAEINEMLLQAKNAEEKAIFDASQIAYELRTEQDHVNIEEKSKRSMEAQLAELDVSTRITLKLPPEMEEQHWPNLKAASENLNWKLEVCKQKQVTIWKYTIRPREGWRRLSIIKKETRKPGKAFWTCH
jgi:hypothetical protein